MGTILSTSDTHSTQIRRELRDNDMPLESLLEWPISVMAGRKEEKKEEEKKEKEKEVPRKRFLVSPKD